MMVKPNGVPFSYMVSRMSMSKFFFFLSFFSRFHLFRPGEDYNEWALSQAGERHSREEKKFAVIRDNLFRLW